MFKRAMMGLAAIIAVMAGVMAGPSPAMATYSQCNNGNFCLFRDADGGTAGGNAWQWNAATIKNSSCSDGSSTQVGCIALGGSTNNAASSLWHRAGCGSGTCAIQVWDYFPGSLAGNYNTHNLGAQGNYSSVMNDKISYIRASGF